MRRTGKTIKHSELSVDRKLKELKKSTKISLPNDLKSKRK